MISRGLVNENQSSCVQGQENMEGLVILKANHKWRHTIFLVVQRSSHAMWIHVCTTKELIPFEISKEVGDLLAASVINSVTLSGLWSSSLLLIDLL